MFFIVTFVNDSPQLEGNSATAEFIVSRAAKLIECGIRSQGQRQERVNCKCMTYALLDAHNSIVGCMWCTRKRVGMVINYIIITHQRIQ